MESYFGKECAQFALNYLLSLTIMATDYQMSCVVCFDRSMKQSYFLTERSQIKILSYMKSSSAMKHANDLSEYRGLASSLRRFSCPWLALPTILRTDESLPLILASCHDNIPPVVSNGCLA